MHRLRSVVLACSLTILLFTGSVFAGSSPAGLLCEEEPSKPSDNQYVFKSSVSLDNPKDG